MSRVTRYKHTLKEMMDDDYELPKESQRIVRVVSSRGNNLHEVEPAEPDVANYLVSMPNKFRKNVWVKRGDYVLVEPIEEGDKVRAEICRILTPDHVKEYSKAGVWPKRFIKKREHEMDDAGDDDGSDMDGFVVKNLNRPVEMPESDDDEDSSTEESEEEESIDNSNK